MKKIILILAVALSSLSLVAQKTPHEQVESFFQEFKSKGTSAALDVLFSSNKWIQERKDAVEQTKSQLENNVNQMGVYCGYEQLISREVGSHLHQFTYLVLFERQPLRFNFLYYKADDVWRILNFKYDDRISDELFDKSWQYYLEKNRNNR